MILTPTTTETITSGLTPVIQLLSPEYQGYVTTGISIALGAVALYFTVISPLIKISSNAKALLQSKLDNESLKEKIPMNQEEFDQMINGTFSNADKLMIKAKIVELKAKLPFADEESKVSLQNMIDELEASLV